MKCSSRMNESLVKKITSVLLVLSGISLILKKSVRGDSYGFCIWRDGACLAAEKG